MRHLVMTMLLLLALTFLAVESSSNNESFVTSSWQNGNETTSSDWNSTEVHNSSFVDDIGTTTETTTAEPGEESYWQYQEMLKWFRYAPPFLIVLANVGNTFSVITLQNPTFRQLRGSSPEPNVPQIVDKLHPERHGNS